VEKSGRYGEELEPEPGAPRKAPREGGRRKDATPLHGILEPVFQKTPSGKRLQSVLTQPKELQPRLLLDFFLSDEELQPLRDLAGEILEEVGGPSIAQELRRLVVERDEHPDGVRAAALEILAEIDPEGAPGFLLGVLQDEKSMEVRRSALFGLKGQRFPAGREAEAVRLAVACLSDASEEIQVQATDLLGLLRAPSGTLRGLLEFPSAAVRMHAIEAIAASGTGTGEDGAALLSLIRREKNAEVRAYAIEGLSRMGRNDAVPELRDLLGDPDPLIAVEAASALAALGAEGVLRDFALTLLSNLDDEYVLSRILDSARCLLPKRPDNEQKLWAKVQEVADRLTGGLRRGAEVAPWELASKLAEPVVALRSFYEKR
jgi:HEAT repeat protein